MRRLGLPALRIVTGSLVGLVVGALLAWIVLPPGMLGPLARFLWIPQIRLIHQFSNSILVVWSTGIALLAGIANELGSSESWSRFIDDFRRPLRNLLLAITVICGCTFIWVGGTTTPQAADYPYRVFPLAAILLFAVMAVLLTTKYRPSSSSFSSERLGALALLGLLFGGAFLAGGVFAYATDVLAAATSSGVTVQSNTGTGLALLVLVVIGAGLVTIALFAGVVLSLFLALTLATAQLITPLMFLHRRSAA